MLVLPVAGAIIAVWVAAAIRAVLYGDVQPFLIATGPLTALCGYVMGLRMVRAKDETGG